MQYYDADHGIIISFISWNYDRITYLWKECLLIEERIKGKFIQTYIMEFLHRICIKWLILCELCFPWDRFMSPTNVESKLCRNKLDAFHTQRITKPKYQAQCRLRLRTIAVSFRFVYSLYCDRNRIYPTKIPIFLNHRSLMNHWLCNYDGFSEHTHAIYIFLSFSLKITLRCYLIRFKLYDSMAVDYFSLFSISLKTLY